MTRSALMTTAAQPAAVTPPEPLAVRLPEATRLSGFSRSDLYRRAARGDLVFLKAGKSVLVEYASLKAAVAALPRADIKSAA